MENYLKQSIVGKGSYGTVYKVKCRRTGKEFALKYHTRDEDVIGVEEATVRELSSLSALKGHPYVIQMLDSLKHVENLYKGMPFEENMLSSERFTNGHHQRCQSGHCVCVCFGPGRPPIVCMPFIQS
uniref:Protein kinase domain-containing protein n=1 Tax=Monopterus albus TaxID=43700 RepID=A0A3Q3QZ02_MONAL